MSGEKDIPIVKMHSGFQDYYSYSFLTINTEGMSFMRFVCALFVCLFFSFLKNFARYFWMPVASNVLLVLDVIMPSTAHDLQLLTL